MPYLSNAVVLANHLIIFHALVASTEAVGIAQQVRLEPYLYLTKIIKHWVALTRLRISCHRLEIERGRYHKPTSTPAHLRLCKDCESVEDEPHFVCVCPKYDLLREHLVSIVRM